MCFHEINLISSDIVNGEWLFFELINLSGYLHPLLQRAHTHQKEGKKQKKLKDATFPCLGTL